MLQKTSQSLYQLPAAPIKGLYASLPSLSSVTTVNLKTNLLYLQKFYCFSCCNEQICKKFDRIEYQHTPEEYLHQGDPRMVFIMEEQPLDLVAYNQRNKQNIYIVHIYNVKIQIYIVLYLELL